MTSANCTSARERIEFVGWTEGARKRELVGNAALFALASRHENFGVSVLEADTKVSFSINPTQVILCDGACDLVRESDNGQVNIVFGCATLIP